MIESPKILAQAYPPATTLTDIYTVSTSAAMVSTVVVCNHDADSAHTFRLSVAPGGAGDSPEQYLYFDLPVEAGDTFACTFGIGMANGTVMRAYTSDQHLSFNVLGEEISS